MTTESDCPSDFPLYEEFEDFSGRRRSFVITCFMGPLGYTVRATEQRHRKPGYEFSAHSETSPYSALGRVREKTRRGMATRHISREDGYLQMLHDELNGRISSSDHGDAVLVVDGISVDMEDLARILQTHEGFEFKLRIVDALA